MRIDVKVKWKGLGEGSAIPGVFTFKAEQGVLSKVCVVFGM